MGAGKHPTVTVAATPLGDAVVGSGVSGFKAGDRVVAVGVLGGIPDANSAYLLLRGMKTLALRIYLAVVTVLLVFALEMGGRDYAWGSPVIVGALATSVVLFGTLVFMSLQFPLLRRAHRVEGAATEHVRRHVGKCMAAHSAHHDERRTEISGEEIGDMTGSEPGKREQRALLDKSWLLPGGVAPIMQQVVVQGQHICLSHHTLVHEII